MTNPEGYPIKSTQELPVEEGFAMEGEDWKKTLEDITEALSEDITRALDTAKAADTADAVIIHLNEASLLYDHVAGLLDPNRHPDKHIVKNIPRLYEYAEKTEDNELREQFKNIQRLQTNIVQEFGSALKSLQDKFPEYTEQFENAVKLNNSESGDRLTWEDMIQQGLTDTTEPGEV